MGAPELEEEVLAGGSSTCRVVVPVLLARASCLSAGDADKAARGRQLGGRAHQKGQRGQAFGGLGKRVVEKLGCGLWQPRGHLSPCTEARGVPEEQEGHSGWDPASQAPRDRGERPLMPWVSS